MPEDNINNEELLSTAKARWKSAESAENENRILAIDDLNFLHGDHWPQKIKSDREEDGRPCLTINRLPSFVDQIIGDMRQQRPHIICRPVDSKGDPVTAKMIEGLIRSIEYLSCAESVYDNAGECQVNSGWGYMRVDTEYADDKTFDQEPRIKRIPNQFSVYMDPTAKEPDGRDANWCFVCEDMTVEDFKQKWPKAEQSQNGWERGVGEREHWWVVAEGMVRVAEYWVKTFEYTNLALLESGEVVLASEVPEGETPRATRKAETPVITRHILSSNEVLEPEQSWAGKYIPIVRVAGKSLNVEGKVYLRGVVRHAIDSARMYDYWRSAATEVVALAPKAPFIGTDTQFEGHETEWANANTTCKPYLSYKHDPMAPGAPTRAQPAQPPTGIFAEAQISVEDMKGTIGIYDAGLGKRSNETSGIAIQQRQKESDVGHYAFADNLSQAIAQVGRILVDLIPHLYDTQRIIRIRNTDDSEAFVEINKPMMDETGVNQQKDEEGSPLFENDFTVGRYDIVVETGDTASTQRQAAAEQLERVITAVPELMGVLGDLWAKNLDWPGADEMAKRLRKTIPADLKEPSEDDEQEEPQAPPPPTPQEQLEAQKLQLEAQKFELEGEKLQVEKMKIEADVQKTVMETEKTEEDYREMAREEAMNVVAEIHGAQSQEGGA